MQKILFETQRMNFRAFTMDDRKLVNVFLQDPEVMYAWEHGFSDEEVIEWLEKNIERYQKDGYGWLCAEEKSTGKNIGAIGLIYTQNINGVDGWEIAYIVNKEFWGKGYATEGAQGCIAHAFDVIGADQVFSQMRINNDSSRAVAEKIGMEYVATYDRLYRGAQMPHHVYVMRKK